MEYQVPANTIEWARPQLALPVLVIALVSAFLGGPVMYIWLAVNTYLLGCNDWKHQAKITLLIGAVASAIFCTASYLNRAFEPTEIGGLWSDVLFSTGQVVFVAAALFAYDRQGMIFKVHHNPDNWKRWLQVAGPVAFVHYIVGLQLKAQFPTDSFVNVFWNAGAMRLL